ncbi:MAG: hypothetical protein ONA69_10165 [candidate division KSB1 bacterium]|nr:hypothetical protein [candidate division KSB1 bacterium]MDZ7347142.1 hypothetical protein [candidate division KSB1 bacterium]
MKVYLYLSMIPEALIYSMLPPDDFGRYYAVGTRKKTRGEAIFFSVDENKVDPSLPLEAAAKRCVPNPDGSPKRSVYVSIYRALEHVPINALKNLYLATSTGHVLEIKSQPYKPSEERRLHLYQELAPVDPMIASNLEPLAFSRTITNKGSLVYVPRLAFVELTLGNLAENPKTGSAYDLPYRNIDHLRDCLLELVNNPSKLTKAVSRAMGCELIFRTIKNGFFVGDDKEFAFYPFPSLEELEDKYYEWWRSANLIPFED